MEYSLSWEANSSSTSQEIPRWHFMQAEVSLPHLQVPATCPYLEHKRFSPNSSSCEMFRNIVRFYGEELLTSRLTPKLEDHPLLAARDCSFNISAAAVLPHKTKVA